MSGVGRPGCSHRAGLDLQCTGSFTEPGAAPDAAPGRTAELSQLAG